MSRDSVSFFPPIAPAHTLSSAAEDLSMNFYAHSLENQGPDKWEPLFTADCPALKGNHCPACDSLDPRHGHLNKVAWWTAKFAAEMFPSGPDRDAARQWGYLAGLWHDLGKFAPELQQCLKSKSDPHSGDATGKIDHSTAGAQHAVKSHLLLGHLLGYPMAGHHSGLLDGISNHACQASRLQKTDLPECKNVPSEITETLWLRPRCEPANAALKKVVCLSFILPRAARGGLSARTAPHEAEIRSESST